MGDWKPEKEQLLPGADDDEAAYLSHKFFLWTIFRECCEVRSGQGTSASAVGFLLIEGIQAMCRIASLDVCRSELPEIIAHSILEDVNLRVTTFRGKVYDNHIMVLEVHSRIRRRTHGGPLSLGSLIAIDPNSGDRFVAGAGWESVYKILKQDGCLAPYGRL